MKKLLTSLFLAVMMPAIALAQYPVQQLEVGITAGYPVPLYRIPESKTASSITMALDVKWNVPETSWAFGMETRGVPSAPSGGYLYFTL